MKFLVDNASSLFVRTSFERAATIPCTSVTTTWKSADDERISARADEEGRVIVSADTDCGTLLASQGARFPSLVLFRGEVSRHPESLVNSFISHLPQIEGLL